MQYIVLMDDHYNTKKEFTNRKKLLSFIEKNKANINAIYKVVDNTKRMLGATDEQKRYKVGINYIVEDQDYCSQVNKQYSINVYAKSKKEAEMLALQDAIRTFGHTLEKLEVVWAKENPLPEAGSILEEK